MVFSGSLSPESVRSVAPAGIVTEPDFPVSDAVHVLVTKVPAAVAAVKTSFPVRFRLLT
jgi:hypothetical protein